MTSAALAAMHAAARAAHPREACGILLGEGGRIAEACQTRNAHPEPATHFEIDPQALIDAHRAARSGGPQVLGYFHSHPNGLATPSATDRKCAAGDGRIWAIVAADDVTFWRDGEEGFAALSFARIES
ncbi:M67 family metallopeptidase [Erythrobacter fulvus]|uniref:M67 family metallopeptidase n=1 Tax=Erythrobacter fulvus TaxID=2987523 RepID=UPI0035AB7A83